MQVSNTFVEKRQNSYENIQTEKGIKLRVNRSIQVEGAFEADLKKTYSIMKTTIFITKK